MLEVRGLRVTFGTLRAVRDVSVEVAAGACVVVLGGTGAGKSTLLRALTGRAGQAARISARVARIDGARVGVIDAAFAADSVGGPGRGGWAARRAAEVLRVLGERPDSVVGDEVLAGLGVLARREVVRALAERKAAGAALLLTAQRIGELAEVADRVLVLHEGEVVERGEARDVLASPVHPVTRALLGRDDDAAFGKGGGGGVMLEARGLRKEIAGRVALREASVKVRGAGVVGVAGEPGAGKTLLARVLDGTVPADAGTVVLDGKPVEGRAAWKAARRAVRVVPQDPAERLAAHRTVGRVLEAATRGPLPGGRRDTAVALLDAVGLPEELLDRAVGGLPGGTLRLVAVAEALATGPRVLVWDAPFAGLDARGRARLVGLIAGLRDERGVGHLVLAHPDEVPAGLCDSVAVLEAGKIVSPNSDSSGGWSVHSRPDGVRA